MPTVFSEQPAHLGGAVVEAHLGHHFIWQHLQTDHRIVIHQSLRLLTSAFIVLLEQRGEIGNETGHACV